MPPSERKTKCWEFRGKGIMVSRREGVDYAYSLRVF